jgi:hypothetical protein
MRDLIAHVHLSLAFFLLCHGNLRPLSFIFSSFSSLCQLPPCLAPCLLWQLPSAPYPLHVIHFCAHFNSFFLSFLDIQIRYCLNLFYRPCFMKILIKVF